MVRGLLSQRSRTRFKSGNQDCRQSSQRRKDPIACAHAMQTHHGGRNACITSPVPPRHITPYRHQFASVIHHSQLMMMMIMQYYSVLRIIPSWKSEEAKKNPATRLFDARPITQHRVAPGALHTLRHSAFSSSCSRTGLLHLVSPKALAARPQTCCHPHSREPDTPLLGIAE